MPTPVQGQWPGWHQEQHVCDRKQSTHWGSRVALCSSGTAAMMSTSLGALARE